MASVEDVVKRLTIVHTTPGADEARRKIQSVAHAQRDVAKGICDSGKRHARE